MPELETNCELLWCKISLAGRKTLYVGAYYRPHESDVDSLNQLEASLSKMINEDILLAGDFNLPGWDWAKA